MNKLVPFTKFSKKGNGGKLPFLSNTSVVVDGKGIPLGFVFGRDSFISLLEYLDSEFERRVEDPKKAFDNPAGRLIDMIEDNLPVNPDFVKDLRSTLKRMRKTDWIPLKDVARSLHV